ncbi:Asp-tRNA(Asn)/Glu-tRNA(Gln) amidotransferase subunit GatB [Clostridiaceae bacterium NSJ-31]|uniref:Aspartyl/glutamyl-tRNA(Asn/Gln) amidotransferase subunit B n=1 Tax=Ligaoa zhengdingensis TaxID=2763658 RepID=A0A926DVT6_9FIRM|nr:Asp-tRNA(Asn)/Glu-tRNA(Gln) amidotransferase subunit GatB [Ligaoa zhengdingensis]MBC8545641.1 Asp-tRNA(Asn)/Glu-tRNA(Gln) amidotransferase subunit GatB [Ligaoa zhengdingensis]
MNTSAYEMVIGLEVHVELKTRTKIFCECSTAFGAEPNTQCCPVCMGMPGTLPVLNKQVVRYAVKAGLATHCSIARYSKQDRKNYFYPDLPKAYQISQYDLPLCSGGWLDIEGENGPKRIGITRIHIEEDAGKLVHKEGGGTLCDYNRCGVPLIEIVSEPDIRSAAEAAAYLRKLRAIMLYVGVSDCKMQEGSLRCDVNLSVRKKGSQTLGTRTEMKNLNSFQFIQKAIEYEFQRQVEAVEAGEEIVQETRRFDQATGKTFSMRKKEDANDYRYFPDPDLVPIVLSQEVLAAIGEEIPELPDARKQEYVERYGLTAGDAEALVNERAVADYFEAAAASTKAPKLLANLITSEVFRLLAPEQTDIPIAPEHLATLADLLADERLGSAAGKKLVSLMWHQDADPVGLAEEHQLWQISDEEALRPAALRAVEENARAAADYKKGKSSAIQTLIGQVMRATGGRANPVVTRALLEKLLEE